MRRKSNLPDKVWRTQPRRYLQSLHPIIDSLENAIKSKIMNTTTTNQDLQTDLFVSMAIASWNSQVRQFNAFLEIMTAERIGSEMGPGKNTGIYLLGHLTAVADGMLTLFGLQDKLYPELFEP